MDETSGTVMHDSVGTHNGTLHSVQLGLPGFTGRSYGFNDSSSYVHNGRLHSVQLGPPGFAGTSYGFNGSSSYVTVPSSADLNPGSATITFTIHLKTTGTPPPAPADWDLLRKGVYKTGGGIYKMELRGTGKLFCGFKGTRGYAGLARGPAINDGRWHTVSCVKTSTAIEVVVDGLVFTKAKAIGSIANTTAVTIGSHPGSDWYKGQLDEASIRIG
jgi:hypothetical protein